MKFFASYRELLGEDEVLLDLDEESTVGDALSLLKDRFPALAEQGYSPLTACNLVHVSKRHGLSDGDELAIFPPVSGG
ncbi:MAG TPA: MoaD/ThiS family protein [Candidatus Polarisedimenticolaceae bacterium]|nr:MoaD/ThiS family protein [Candidatus Polarisedimenticolaceae bacterium]